MTHDIHEALTTEQFGEPCDVWRRIAEIIEGRKEKS